VVAHVAAQLALTENQLTEQTSSGLSRFTRNVHWARFILSKAGLIGASRRGVWTLAEEGGKIKVSPSDAIRIFKQVHQRFGGTRKQRDTEPETEPEEVDSLAAGTDHRARVLGILMKLPAAGFENLCQQLLREAGFEQVVVTGRSGDGGIDGHGLLQVNPLVSFRVLFQCKRYGKPVQAEHVRNFRGAMQGRAEKGIILTTSTFTSNARQEAVRDGVPPIELVDGEKLLEMFETFEFGLTKRAAYDIKEGFFEGFGGLGQAGRDEATGQ